MPRMMHPEHGWHVPVNSLEEAQMRECGWVDDDGKALAEKRGESVKATESVRPVEPRKPGRPKKSP